MIETYKKLMDLWEQYEDILPNSILYVAYEDIVDNFKPTLKNILSFLSEEWDDTLVDFYKKIQEKEVVRTPSYSQVSENIYTNSKYRWKRYHQFFEPYFDRLTPYATKLGYESLI